MKTTYILCTVLLWSFGNAVGQELTHQITELLTEIVVDNGPGVTIGVIKDGELSYHNQKGLASLEYDIPIDNETQFGLASITKQFTSACIGVLAKQGKLDIEDDVRKYVPELPDYGNTIRIRHLMNHTSGLRNHNVLLDLKGFDYAHRGYTNADIEKLIFSQKGVNNQPGEKMLYANSNYVLLALIINRVSGKTIQQFGKEYLFEPLGLSHTYFRSSMYDIVENPAYKYFQMKGAWAQQKSVNECIGAGGAVSTITDMLKWSTIFTDPNHSYRWLADFLTRQDVLNNGQKSNYGQGVFLDTYQQTETVHHSGRDRGLRTQLLIAPEKQFAVVVFSNASSYNSVEISYKIFDMYFPTNTTAKDPIATSFIQPKLNAFVGYYQELNSDMGMRIFVEDDTLRAKSSFGRFAIPLVAINARAFQRANDPSVRHNFFNDPGVEWDMIVDFGGASFYFEKSYLVDPNDVIPESYVGTYHSKELDVTYIFSVADQQLMVSFPNNPNITLKPGQQDEFGTRRRTKYTFYRDNNGAISGFYAASEGTVKDIVFEKTM